ncbi:MAG: hypothetical protein Q9226_009148 [Calogaya cf. arnoldii]
MAYIDKATGTMKTGCVLDKEWDNIKEDPALEMLVKILRDHLDQPFLIVREPAGGRTISMYFGTQKAKTVAKDK